MTSAKVSLHRVMGLVIYSEAMLQNIQNEKPQGIPGIGLQDIKVTKSKQLDYLSGSGNFRSVSLERSLQNSSSNVLLLYYTALLIVIFIVYMALASNLFIFLFSWISVFIRKCPKFCFMKKVKF